MYYILRILFLLFLFFYGRDKSTLFKMLVALQVISFMAEWLIDAYKVETDDLLTYFYVLLSELMLLLVMAPWAKVKIKGIFIKERRFQRLFEKVLIPTLLGIFLMNLVLAVIIMYMIPDVSDYKLKDGWKDLYESIPMFALMNRVSYITQYMGYFAIPISFYYFSIDNNKRGRLFLFLSTSSLMAGIAAYSRAQMLVYGLCVVANFFLCQKVFSEEKRNVIKKYTYRAVLILSVIFLYTTINRFSSDNMAYYGDRIPKTSKIQDPIVYSFMDYLGQGFPNGTNLLVKYSPDKNFKGQGTFFFPLLFLDYFGIIHWDAVAAEENRDKVYGYDGGAFHGYTCSVVYDFGFILTLLLGLVYYSYVKRKVSKSSRITMSTALLLAYIVIEPTVSIFYSSIGIYVFPALFYFVVRFLYMLKRNNRIKVQRTPPVLSF